MEYKKFKSKDEELKVKEVLNNQKLTDEEASEIFRVFLKTRKKVLNRLSL